MFKCFVDLNNNSPSGLIIFTIYDLLFTIYFDIFELINFSGFLINYSGFREYGKFMAYLDPLFDIDFVFWCKVKERNPPVIVEIPKKMREKAESL